MDKSMTSFISILLAIGGVVILILTWLEPLSLSERIATSIIGTAGIMTVFIRFLMMQVKAARVRIARAPDKSDIKNNNSIAK